MSFKFKYKNNIKYCYIESFDKTNVVNSVFTTRVGDKDDVLETVGEILGISREGMAVSKQIHGTNIAIVDDIEEYNNFREKVEGIDGIITNKTDVALVTFYADCVPLFFFDINKNVIGLAHAGWKGSLKGIGAKMVSKMKLYFNSVPKDILVGIGPSIGKCCYEVGEDLFKLFNNKFEEQTKYLFYKKEDKYFLDLWMCNKNLLLKEGIPENNITVSYLCTSCNVDTFYSYRRENGTNKRMAAALRLNK